MPLQPITNYGTPNFGALIPEASCNPDGVAGTTDLDLDLIPFGTEELLSIPGPDPEAVGSAPIAPSTDLHLSPDTEA